MHNIMNVRMDIKNIPEKYVFSKKVLGQHMANLRSKKPVQAWIPVKRSEIEKSIMAVKQDIQLIKERLDNLGIAPEIAQTAYGILRDFGVGNLMDLSRVTALAESVTPNVTKEITSIYAQRLLAADLQSCIHAWQMYDALQAEAEEELKPFLDIKPTEKVDVIAFLEGVLKKNTRHYQSDFRFDVCCLRKAALESYQENRTFLWLSRPCGTVCVLEREAYIKGSADYIFWTHYDYEAAHIIAYRVVVAPNEKDDVTMGWIIPLNYGEHVKRIAQKALPAKTVEMTFEDDTVLEIPFEEYYTSYRELIDAHGKMVRIYHKPEDEHDLEYILQEEREISAANNKNE